MLASNCVDISSEDSSGWKPSNFCLQGTTLNVQLTLKDCRFRASEICNFDTIWHCIFSNFWTHSSALSNQFHCCLLSIWQAVAEPLSGFSILSICSFWRLWIKCSEVDRAFKEAPFRLRRGERFPENILLGPTHSTNLHKLSSDSVPPMFDLIFHRALEEGAISSTMACCALSCTFVGNAFSAFSAFGLLCSDSGGGCFLKDSRDIAWLGLGLERVKGLIGASRVILPWKCLSGKMCLAYWVRCKPRHENAGEEYHGNWQLRLRVLSPSQKDFWRLSNPLLWGTTQWLWQ